MLINARRRGAGFCNIIWDKIIIDYQSRKNIGGEGGVLSFCDSFWDKITIYYRSRKKIDFRRVGSGLEYLQGEGFLRIMRHPLNKNGE